MTKSLDFFSENLASREAKTDFLSFVVRELLTFEFVVSNRCPPGPLIKKFCLVRIGLKQKPKTNQQKILYSIKINSSEDITTTFFKP